LSQLNLFFAYSSISVYSQALQWGSIYVVSVVNWREDEAAYRPKCLHAKTMTSHVYINHCELLNKQLVLHLILFHFMLNVLLWNYDRLCEPIQWSLLMQLQTITGGYSAIGIFIYTRVSSSGRDEWTSQKGVQTSEREVAGHDHKTSHWVPWDTSWVNKIFAIWPTVVIFWPWLSRVHWLTAGWVPTFFITYKPHSSL
jgi:hypothetical protein